MNTTMNREARLTLTYLITLTPEELGLENDIPEDEFIEAAERYALNDMNMNEWIPTDIEIEVAED